MDSEKSNAPNLPDLSGLRIESPRTSDNFVDESTSTHSTVWGNPTFTPYVPMSAQQGEIRGRRSYQVPFSQASEHGQNEQRSRVLSQEEKDHASFLEVVDSIFKNPAYGPLPITKGPYVEDPRHLHVNSAEPGAYQVDPQWKRLIKHTADPEPTRTERIFPRPDTYYENKQQNPEEKWTQSSQRSNPQTVGWRTIKEKNPQMCAETHQQTSSNCQTQEAQYSLGRYQHSNKPQTQLVDSVQTRRSITQQTQQESHTQARQECHPISQQSKDRTLQDRSVQTQQQEYYQATQPLRYLRTQQNISPPIQYEVNPITPEEDAQQIFQNPYEQSNEADFFQQYPSGYALVPAAYYYVPVIQIPLENVASITIEFNYHPPEN